MAGIKGVQRKRVASEARQKAWTAMRIMRQFDVAAVVATSGVSLDNLRRFILKLEAAGYLTRVHGHVSGRAGSRIIYRLARNSGPKVPITYNNGRVYDPNLDKHFDPDGEEVEPTEPCGAF